MGSPQYSIVFSAPVAGTATAGSVGDVLIPDVASGLYVKSTTANRGTRRSTGIALSAYATGGVTDIQQVGQVDAVTAGLGTGTASWVRVSAAGTLERATVSGADDVIGWVETNGTLHAAFGFLTAAIVNGGGGNITQDVVTWVPAGSPSASSQSVQATKDTADATAASAMVLALTDQSLTDVNATVIGRSSGDVHFAIDLRATYSRVGTVITARRAPATSAPLATNPAGWAAVIDQAGTDVRVRVTGAAATAIKWSVIANTQIVTIIGAAPAVLDPATLALTGWWRTDYAASPWTPSTSVGTSGTNGNLTEATNPPITGAAVNALIPASFNGSSRLITGANPMSSFVTGTAGSIAVLFNANTAAAPGAGVYDDQPLFCDSTANVALGFSSSGVRGGFYDSGASWKMTANVACATGGWHLAQMKWNASTIFVRVDSGAWVSIAAVTLFTLTGLPRLGKNYNTAYLDGRIADVMLASTTLADATFDGLIAYVNSRYGLAL